MANVVTANVLSDGPRNYVVDFVGTIDTAGAVTAMTIDPASMSTINGFNKPSQFCIARVITSIQDGLEFQTSWDATSALPAISLIGRMDQIYDNFGSIQNQAGAGMTGKLLFSAAITAAGTYNFSVTLELVKQNPTLSGTTG